LWVFNEWLGQNKPAEREIRNWEEQWEKWTSDGVSAKVQIRREAEMVAEMVSSLPVFVLKNLGTYYSGTMLMYATGTDSHPTDLYRWLRDNRLKGRTEREVGEAGMDDHEPAGPPIREAPGQGGLNVVEVLPGAVSVDRRLLGALRIMGGAS
jgi:hypothetical protein